MKYKTILVGTVAFGLVTFLGAGCGTQQVANTNAVNNENEVSGVQDANTNAVVVNSDDEAAADTTDTNSSGDETATSDWVTYTNEEYGFSFQYPSTEEVTWNSIDRCFFIEKTGGETGEKSDLTTSEPPNTICLLGQFDGSKYPSLEEWYAAWTRNGVNQNETTTLVKVNGQDSLLIDDSGITFTSYLLVSNNEVLSLSSADWTSTTMAGVLNTFTATDTIRN